MTRPAHLTWSLFRASTELSAGNLTEKDLRSRRWREVRPDVYADSRVPLEHSLACHAAFLLLPDRVHFSGASAAYLLGVLHAADYEDEVQVTVEPDASVRRVAGVRVRKTVLAAGDTDWIDGLPVTSPLRTAWDLGATLPAPDSVPIIDALLGLALVTPNELHAYAQPRLSRRGGRTAARAFALSDGRARTPESSRLRLAALAAGLPPAIPHHPIAFAGRLHTPELAWPDQKVGLTFLTDGARYSEEDWVVLRVDPDDMAAELPAVLRQLRSALLGRGWHGPRS